MRGRIGLGAAALATGVVLMTAGCGGSKSVDFQPAGGSGSASSQPTVTVTQTAGADGANGVSTDPASGVVITRNGSTICVKGPHGGTACTSGHGTVVVDGVTVKDGVVVSGGANGANGVSTVPPQPTKGTVRISGALTWSGTASGTCGGHGTEVRTVSAELPNLGSLEVRSVGGDVLQVRLVAKGSSYGLNHVGSNGPVSSTDSRLVITDARLGKGGNQVVLSGDFDC